MILIIGIAVLESLLVALLLWWRFGRGRSSNQLGKVEIEKALQKRVDARNQLKELLTELKPVALLKELLEKQETERNQLKGEQGRVTITYAELESLESRLRELHEIERELKASCLETEEELRILQQRQNELDEKKDRLKEELDKSLQQLEELSSELEINAQMALAIDKAKGEIVKCQGTIDTLLLQIDEGNQLYVKLKRRYDALDIEYAQLYEKFQESGLIPK
jgi:chromosome segregation ATPase